MITLAEVQALRYGDLIYAIGSPRRDLPASHHKGRTIPPILTLRVSGVIKLWRTRPGEFRLPVKYGLNKSLALTDRNCGDFFLRFADAEAEAFGTTESTP